MNVPAGEDGRLLAWPEATFPAQGASLKFAPAEENTDRVSNNPNATRWRRAARAHQTHWREIHGWPVGSKKGYKRANPYVGSTIERAFAEMTGANFITAAAWDAAKSRLGHRQYAETLDEDRLLCDLLSSMPMAFNLFGPLFRAPSLAATLARRWLGGAVVPENARVEVEFEWSPARDNIEWTGDRTAADVAMLVQTPSRRHLVCIETKYHEASEQRPTPPAGPARRVDPFVTRSANIRDRRRELTLQQGLFDEDTLARVTGSELEQLWRDHLLALSCCAGPNKVDSAQYVLVAPAGNPVWPGLAATYRDTLNESARSTFEFVTVERLLDHWGRDCYWASAIRARYLDVVPS